MKKLIKVVLSVATLFLLFTGTAFADGIGMYAKAELGYSFWAPDIKNVYYESNCFDITPTFGLFPISGNKNFAVEASVDLNFGGKDDIKTTVIAPKVMALFYIPLESIFGKSSLTKTIVPFAGLGFSIPIQSATYSKDGYSYAVGAATTFVINTQLGCKFNVTDKIGITADLNTSLFKPWNWALKVGAMYVIK